MINIFAFTTVIILLYAATIMKTHADEAELTSKVRAFYYLVFALLLTTALIIIQNRL
jgi:cell division protein FtsW (lipid II flippase)